MKSLKTILLGLTAAAGFGVLIGGADAHAESLYTVQPGDTLSTIATQFHGNTELMSQIAADNSLANMDLIFSGDQLVIRTPEEMAAGQIVAQPATVAQAATEVAAEPVVADTTVADTTGFTSSAAKEWIAQRESSGSYTATNGRYIGRYQLDASYLNGDYSAENQERVADQYVASRYGSWEAAQAFWMANGWY